MLIRQSESEILYIHVYTYNNMYQSYETVQSWMVYCCWVTNKLEESITRIKPSSHCNADLGVMSGASASGINGCSGRPFRFQRSQHSAMMQGIKTTKTNIYKINVGRLAVDPQCGIPFP